jgi:hypothetical protein
MDIYLGKFYADNEDNIYRCIALASGPDGYAEAVMKLEGYSGTTTIMFCVFYRSHYAWMDRENPDYRLSEEVDYFPHVVQDHAN